MTSVQIRTSSKLPHDIRTIAHLAVFGMLGFFGLAAVIGRVLSFFVGMPEGMLLSLRPFSVLVTVAAVLFPLALWAFAAPEPPSRFLAPRCFVLYGFAGAMNVVGGIHEGLPWLNGVVGHLVCPSGTDAFMSRSVIDGFSVSKFVFHFGYEPSCITGTVFEDPHHVSFLIAMIVVYVALVALWFAVNVGVVRALAGRAPLRMRFVATPVVFALVLAVLHAFPAPLRLLAEPLRALLT